MALVKKLVLTLVTIPSSAVGVYKLWSPNVSSEPDFKFLTEGMEMTQVQEDAYDIHRQTIEAESAGTLAHQSQEIDWQEQKRLNREIAEKAFKKLDDYSFRIFWSCGIGTGWILDYEIPERADKYPTTWYIATAAHVINGYKFAENPYKQSLPSSVEETQRLRRKLAHRVNSYLPWYSRLSLWDHNTTTCDVSNKYGYSDLNLAKSSNGAELKAEYGGWLNGRMEEPKLFYAAFDLFEENPELGIRANNYKDFAVLEIKFKEEDYARRITNNFADHYRVESTDAINVFADPLDVRYDTEKIQQLEENFFELGYPKGNKGKFEQSRGWDEEREEGYKLLNDHSGLHHDTNQQKIRGFADGNKGIYKVEWNGTRRNDVGHFHLLGINKKYRLEGGASGSLFTDKDGNLLGIHGGGGGSSSTIVPLRGKERRGDHVIKSPKFDLLLGATGQKSSYREQVETYKKNTWLKARGWAHKAKN
ncbi:hypothetical protein WEN_00565 [Mycoplasma wenyonii str. Massachusetts]|uniref:DUF31 domain-containing protein n=1 Tax=Mycoplasma wenyonii (strain Massachusetts) TaxID=1197325 RepID=I6ZIC3_MYCWM|nr:hypothetical protein [Mycoplasma wenyonii]AFN64920.1 hypothetical protein WEN_00565 [Mycoplasma wenyonii str. Massachusetts]